MKIDRREILMKNEQEINELHEILKRMENLRVKKLISPKERPSRLLGNNGILYLLRTLDRSRDLLKDCISRVLDILKQEIKGLKKNNES